MDRTPTEFADALATGDSDRVNDAIEAVEAADATERLARYDELFDACRPVFESEDGYVRQSVVRFLRDAYPNLEVRIGAGEEDEYEGYTLSDTAEPRARLVEFLLTALEDEDGRVRTAAKDAFGTLAVAFNVAELDAEREALLDSFEELAVGQPDDVRNHVVAAWRDVERIGEAGVLSGFEFEPPPEE